MLNFAIIGAGRIGTLHAKHLHNRIPSARVVAVSDPNRSRAARLADQIDAPVAAADHHHLLERDDVHAVLIASPAHTHSTLIADSAAAGKHIFCEKPIDDDLARIDAALAAVDRHQVTLQIGFNRRFDPDFRTLFDTLATGAHGKPHLLRITSHDHQPPPVDYIKTSGGIFLDMTIHDFDMARFLLQDEVTHVYAAGSTLVDPAIADAGDVDTAVTTLRFASGALAVIENCRSAPYGYDQRVELLTSSTRLAVDNRPTTALHVQSAVGHLTTNPTPASLGRYLDAYRLELESFAAAVLGETPVEVTGLDGRAATVLGLAATRSHRESRAVAVSEIDGSTQ